MMNKNKSAKLHLLRFLFLLPVLAVILVSFRKEISDTLTGKQKQLPPIPAAVTDTVPEVTKPNSKGYIINVKDKKGECLLVIKDKTGKEVKRVLLTEWNTDAEKYEEMYGEIPPPHIGFAPPSEYLERVVSNEEFLKRNTTVKTVGWVFNNLDNTVAIVHVFKKDGTEEKYNLDNKEESEEFEKKYGAIPYPPPPPPASSFEAPEPPGVFNYPPPPAAPEAPTPVKLPASVQKINISNKKATVTLKNGQKENYDLSKPEQKEKFEIKYGEFVSPPPPPPAKAELREVPVAVSVPAKIQVAAPATKVELREVPVAVSVPAKIQVAAPAEKVNIIEVPVKISSPAILGNPLIIVDGVIVNKGELNNLDPNLIASFNILKGKTAIALYGEKGSNGVIIIKTKKEKVKPITQTQFLFPGFKNDGC